MPESVKGLTAKLLGTVNLLYRGLFDPQVPWYVKCLITLIIAYIISPIDIIPDFIPLIGLLDELILIPVAVALALKLMPEAVMKKYRDEEEQDFSPALTYLGIALVILVWSLLLILVLLLV